MEATPIQRYKVTNEWTLLQKEARENTHRNGCIITYHYCNKILAMYNKLLLEGSQHFSGNMTHGQDGGHTQQV